MWNDRTFNLCRLTFNLGYTSQTYWTMKYSSCFVTELEDNNVKVYIFSKINVTIWISLLKIWFHPIFQPFPISVRLGNLHAIIYSGFPAMTSQFFRFHQNKAKTAVKKNAIISSVFLQISLETNLSYFLFCTHSKCIGLYSSVQF